jgi:hypothetical protein
LEQIETDKGCEKQKVFADKQGALFRAQRQRQKDKASGDNTDDTFCVHGVKIPYYLNLNVFFV